MELFFKGFLLPVTPSPLRPKTFFCCFQTPTIHVLPYTEREREREREMVTNPSKSYKVTTLLLYTLIFLSQKGDGTMKDAAVNVSKRSQASFCCSHVCTNNVCILHLLYNKLTLKSATF
jgi:hypothetical protein